MVQTREIERIIGDLRVIDFATTIKDQVTLRINVLRS